MKKRFKEWFYSFTEIDQDMYLHPIMRSRLMVFMSKIIAYVIILLAFYKIITVSIQYVF